MEGCGVLAGVAIRKSHGAKMTLQDLDRLITRTDMTPIAKKVMGSVRSAVLSGQAGDPLTNSITWSVSIQTDGGYPATMTFSWKRN